MYCSVTTLEGRTDDLGASNNSLQQKELRDAKVIQGASIQFAEMRREQIATNTKIEEVEQSINVKLVAISEKEEKFESATKDEINKIEAEVIKEETKVAQIAEETMLTGTELQRLAKVTADQQAKEIEDIQNVMDDASKIYDSQQRNDEENKQTIQLQANKIAQLENRMIESETKTQQHFEANQASMNEILSYVKGQKMNTVEEKYRAPSIEQIRKFIPALVVGPTEKGISQFSNTLVTANVSIPTEEMRIKDIPPTDITDQLLKIQAHLKNKKVAYSEWGAYLIECFDKDILAKIPSKPIQWHDWLLFFYQYINFEKNSNAALANLAATPLIPGGNIQEFLIAIIKEAIPLAAAGSYRTVTEMIGKCLPYLPSVLEPSRERYKKVGDLMDFVYYQIPSQACFPATLTTTAVNQVSTNPHHKYNNHNHKATPEKARTFYNFYCPRCNCFFCESNNLEQLWRSKGSDPEKISYSFINKKIENTLEDNLRHCVTEFMIYNKISPSYVMNPNEFLDAMLIQLRILKTNGIL